MDNFRQARGEVGMENDKKEIEMVSVGKILFNHLTERDEWLSYLEGAGVDNWEGYDYACDQRREDREKAGKTEDDGG